MPSDFTISQLLWPCEMGKVSCWHEAEQGGWERALFVQHGQDVLREPCGVYTNPFSPETQWARVWFGALDPFLGRVGQRAASPTGCSVSSLSCSCWNAAPSRASCPGSFWGSWFQRGQKKHSHFLQGRNSSWALTRQIITAATFMTEQIYACRPCHLFFWVKKWWGRSFLVPCAGGCGTELLPAPLGFFISQMWSIQQCFPVL